MIIFVNYRRDDSRGVAGRLHDRLAQAFGRKNIFMDVDNTPPGIDFVSHLNNRVAACEVFLAVIGPNWLNAKNEDGDRRPYAPEDFVAVEIAAALARDIRVIPVLVDGTRMPKAQDLPEVLKPLVRRHAIELRHDQFGRDAEALIERIREALQAKRTTTLRWKAAAGIAAALLLLLCSMWYLWQPTPLSLPQAVQPVKQAEKEGPATNQEAQPVKQAEGPILPQDREDKLSGLFGATVLGFEVAENPSDELRSKYKIKDGINGLLITGVAPNSQAAQRGLSEGDVIVEVAAWAVSNLAQFGNLFNQLKKGGKKDVLLLVSKKDGLRRVTLSMP